MTNNVYKIPRTWGLLLFLFVLAQFSGMAQLTIRVTSIPVNTPANASIYVAGSFNNWQEGNANYKLTSIGNGEYSITVNPSVGLVEYKFTRGSWAMVEGSAGGGFQPNHQVQYNGQPKTVTVSILSWEDLGGSGAGGTAAANVSIMDNNFYIPQLNRNRRIWLYLPPDYQTSTKKYPVLYLQDGQNLFDNNTSFTGEWKVDESLNTLFNNGDYGCIVIGIDNGGASRLDEYSPWVHPQYGGGEGEQYINFIVNTLKPYVDANYRTLPGRQSTGIGGSSMGALISQYGLIERQDVFSKAAVFSPAFWFAGGAAANHVLSTGKQSDVRVYFLAGGQEPDYVESDMADVADAMVEEGFDVQGIYFLTPSDGQHSEWFWAREFPAAYEWLFQDAVTSDQEAGNASSDVAVFPNPSGEWIRIAGDNLPEKTNVQITGIDGKIWMDSTLRTTDPIRTDFLPAGFYSLRVRQTDKKYAVERFMIVR